MTNDVVSTQPLPPTPGLTGALQCLFDAPGMTASELYARVPSLTHEDLEIAVRVQLLSRSDDGRYMVIPILED